VKRQPVIINHSREKLIQFSNGFADGGIIEDLFLFKAARNKSGGANPVNLAGNTAGILENAFKASSLKGDPVRKPAMWRWWLIYLMVSVRSRGGIGKHW